MKKNYIEKIRKDINIIAKDQYDVERMFLKDDRLATYSNLIFLSLMYGYFDKKRAQELTKESNIAYNSLTLCGYDKAKLSECSGDAFDAWEEYAKVYVEGK